jgi:hypothetical protein
MHEFSMEGLKVGSAVGMSSRALNIPSDNRVPLTLKLLKLRPNVTLLTGNDFLTSRAAAAGKNPQTNSKFCLNNQSAAHR